MAGKRIMRRASSLLLTALVACGGDEGTGDARFTTWGEEYIEQEIPADPSGEAGFIDGWTVRYDKFLVVFHAIEVADAAGHVAGRMRGSKLVDNTIPGRKDLFTFQGIAAKHWDSVRYQIKPADADTELAAGEPEDLALMVDNGYAIYVSGTASKSADGTTVTKHFRWGFSSATQYENCQQPAKSGQALLGIVVTNGGVDTSELTTHGDHFFYDRLQASPDPAIATALRFDEKAAADSDGDDEITLAELDAARIDLRLYNPSGLAAPTLGAFVRSLARTVGHFRGEGECTVSAAD